MTRLSCEKKVFKKDFYLHEIEHTCISQAEDKLLQSTTIDLDWTIFNWPLTYHNINCKSSNHVQLKDGYFLGWNISEIQYSIWHDLRKL